ncbi:hypothetical protein ACF8PD_14475 [Vibrio plantisponsor]|uniref:hypothetical protein n=1 Tax=Vibrio plantisponsor TaxID=664643 RepID=UPI00370B4A1D
MVEKSEQDVLRVVEYVIKKKREQTQFSVHTASLSDELNGINKHRIAEILKSICMEPYGSGTLEELTTVDGRNSDSNEAIWNLTAETYFGYMGYLATLEAIKSNQQAAKTNRIAIWALIVAIATLVITGRPDLVTNAEEFILKLL